MSKGCEDFQCCSVKFIANKSEEEKETPSWVLSAAFRRIPCGKIRCCVSWFVHTCFCSAFRKVLSMNFEKRLYSQLKQKVSTVIRGGYSMSSMTSKTEKSHCIPSHEFKCSAQFYLAPPWNLMLALSIVAAQSMSLTSGRPISSLLMAILVVIVSPFTFKSKEPLSLLLRERSHCCSRNVTKLILTVLCKEEILFVFFIYIIRRYLTLQFPCRLMKALPMDSLTPVPGTRSTADVGNPTFTVCILEETTCLSCKGTWRKIPP